MHLYWAAIIRPRRSRSAAAYSHQTFPWTICRSVHAYMRRSVCPVHCGKTAGQIRMLFGIVGRTGPGMRQVVEFGDQSTGRGTFGGEFGARHCNQWGLYGVRMLQRRDAAIFPNYSGQTCITWLLNAVSELFVYFSVFVSFLALLFLARDAFIEQIVALLPWCLSICLSVCLAWACIVIIRCTLVRI